MNRRIKKKASGNESRGLSSPAFFLLVLVVILIGLSGFFETTSRPSHCNSCHIMKPFYQTWSESSHSKTSCVNCHLPASEYNFFSRKSVGLKMHLKNLTLSCPGRRPLAKINESSCLSGNCHKAPYADEPLEFRTVSFSHDSHLSGSKRGKYLNCSSCHGHLVHGNSIDISNPLTCYLCHLKPIDDTDLSTSFTAQCDLCHNVPKEIIRSHGIEMNHLEEYTSTLNCTKCHHLITSGSGEVIQDRCIQCHADRSVLNQAKDINTIHVSHVTEWGMVCSRCHDEITHQMPSIDKPIPTDCESCHPNQHEAVSILYNATSFDNQDRYASPEFLSHLSCQACHIHQTGDRIDQSGVMHLASSQSCNECHYSIYGNFLQQWKRETSSLISSIRDELSNTRPLIEQTSFSVKKKDQLKEILDRADMNLLLAERGGVVHNAEYCITLITRAHDRINMVRTELGGSSRKNDKVEAHRFAFNQRCTPCHFGAVNSTVMFGATLFPHTPHLAKGQLPCTSCHEYSSKWEPHGTLKFTDAQGCKTCHGVGAGCGSCHTGFENKVISVFGNLKSFKHDPHLKNNYKCLDCHFPESSETKHGQSRITKATSCNECHHDPVSGKTCNDCHTTQSILMSGKLEFYPESVKGFHSTLKCDSCHEISRHSRTLIDRRCTGCHDESYPRKINTWLRLADEALVQMSNLIKRAEELALTDENQDEFERIKSRYDFFKSAKPPGAHNPELWQKVLNQDIETLRNWLK